MKKALCLILAFMLSFSALSVFADVEGTIQGDIMLTSTEGEEAIAIPEEPAKTGLNFSDIVADSVLGEAVYKLVDAKVISGYPDGTFRPNAGVTRAELCKMINLVFDLEASASGMTFKDVSTDDWYYNYVLVAVEAGYIKGYNKDTFGGDDPVTREQACAIINRVTKAKGAELFDLPFSDTITDAVSDWAVEDVKRIIANYVMPLEAGGKFRATQNITRGELALALEGFVVIVPEYTVTFETNGGDAIAPVLVKEGKTIVKPEDPKKAKNVFKGWYTDSKLKKAFDFETAITEDMTLYAKWQPESTGGGGGGGVYIPSTDNNNNNNNNGDNDNPPVVITYYTVTFNSKGGSEVEEVVVESGQPVSEPAEPPTKDMMVFTGWYSDYTCTTPFDFSTGITRNYTLYAGWTEDVAATNQEKIANLEIFKDALANTTFDIQPHTDMANIIVSTFESAVSDGRSGAYLTNEYIKTTYAANMEQVKYIWENELFVDTFSDEQQEFKDKVALAMTDAMANGYTMTVSETYRMFREIIGDFMVWE